MAENSVGGGESIFVAEKVLFGQPKSALMASVQTRNKPIWLLTVRLLTKKLLKQLPLGKHPKCFGEPKAFWLSKQEEALLCSKRKHFGPSFKKCCK